MEILFNPNIAYVLLVVGFLLALLAIITPGTGMLEVGAFFSLALAGFIVYHIGIDHVNLWALIAIAVSIVPFVFATRKPKRGLWLGISLVGILAGSLYIFNSGSWLPAVNPILALFVSASVGGFLWLVVGKTVKAQMAVPTHDLGMLIGQTGEAKTTVHDNGSVQVSGELWSARSEKSIPAGSHVRVVNREGFVLVVELEDQSKT
jgi:membrane-bound serine protease (ClpP class)